MKDSCLCGKKGIYKVEHGFLCKVCYLRHIEEKFLRFITKNRLIYQDKKYAFVYDPNMDKIKLFLLEKLFTKFGIRKFKIFSTKFTGDYKKYLKQLAKELKGYSIILPNTVDFECVLALKNLVEEKEFGNYFFPKMVLDKVEFVKPFQVFKDEDLKQYSEIKNVMFKKTKVPKDYKGYEKALNYLDSKYFIKRSFLASVQNLSSLK